MEEKIEVAADAIAAEFEGTGAGIANTKGVARLARVVAEMAAEVAQLRRDVDGIKQQDRS